MGSITGITRSDLPSTGLIIYSVTMKKVISCLASIVLVIVPVQGSQAANAPKAGETCPKEGMTQTAGNKKYNCIKLGTKLYWNNGVQVKKQSNSSMSALLKIPATCTVLFPEWSLMRERIGSGDVSYSAMILNSSVSFSAVNIMVYVDWYDEYGQIKSEKISIPRLIPGQSVALGQYSFYSINQSPKYPEPNEISIRSTCKSERYKKVLPTVTGKSPVTVKDIKEFEDSDTRIVYIDSTVLFDNKFTKTLSCDPKCNYQIYGVFKDNFDNIFGGFSGDPSVIEDIAPGDSGVIDVSIELAFTDYLPPEWLERVTRFDYTIIPKF